jgi:hypothetical protein
LGEDAQATGSQTPELSFQDFVDTNEFGCGYAALGIIDPAAARRTVLDQHRAIGSDGRSDKPS